MEVAANGKRATSAEILANRVLEHIADNGLEVGSHIKEVEFSKVLKVSRSPIRNAFAFLQDTGFLVKKPNQGFFLAKVPETKATPSIAVTEIEQTYLAPICYNIGQDYLAGKLSRSFTENELISRYELSRKAIQEALIAMEKDGWLKRNIGYGWEFNEFISSPTAYAQSYRFRQLIEPEALRDPGFTIDQTVIQMLRMSQIDILNNDEKLVSAAEMFNAGVLFHESLVNMSGNVFLLDALKRVNRLRRLVEYNVNGKRPIPRQECEEHLRLLELIETGKLADAANFLEKHLARTAKQKEEIAKSLFG
ncbi:GntR family transcriptional regulator [Photobacterium rosenbergii]|uniref:GntR family transcriptional regulator n=1 Tax=Photobacterium rosenbergii TaxID=294936 RepID=A0A2T3N6F6_9GAMM|nr:GntR family transcriptional regulator [Photobacterium rosenbergii]PSW08307.1 GntR family transcriptional regulator [Photobacterium rosenbergii]